MLEIVEQTCRKAEDTWWIVVNASVSLGLFEIGVLLGMKRAWPQSVDLHVVTKVQLPLT
jgi:hypothetical protein